MVLVPRRADGERMPPLLRRSALRAAVAVLLLAFTPGPAAALGQPPASAPRPLPGLTLTGTELQGGYTFFQYAEPAPERWSKFVAAGLAHWGAAPSCGAPKILLQSSDHPRVVATANQQACAVWVMHAWQSALTEWERCVVMVHEIGHLHGLDHDPAPAKLMSAVIAPRGQLEPVPACDALPAPPRPTGDGGLAVGMDDDGGDHVRAATDAPAQRGVSFPVRGSRAGLTLAATPTAPTGEPVSCSFQLKGRVARRWVQRSAAGCRLTIPRRLLAPGKRTTLRVVVRDAEGAVLGKLSAHVQLPRAASGKPRLVGKRVSGPAAASR